MFGIPQLDNFISRIDRKLAKNPPQSKRKQGAMPTANGRGLDDMYFDVDDPKLKELSQRFGTMKTYTKVKDIIENVIAEDEKSVKKTLQLIAKQLKRYKVDHKMHSDKIGGQTLHSIVIEIEPGFVDEVVRNMLGLKYNPREDVNTVVYDGEELTLLIDVDDEAEVATVEIGNL